MLVMGHRGWDAKYPENTLLSFRKALELGIDIIEFDVTQSADGQLVVIHDDTLNRTTNGKGPVSAQRLADLKRLDAGSWKSPEFAGERIPTLDETLDLLKEFPSVLLNVEIKDCLKSTARSSIDAIARKGLIDRSYFACFDADVLESIKGIDSAIKTQGFPSRMMRGFKKGRAGTYAKMDYVGIWVGDVSEQLVSFFTDIGIEAGAWCVDDVPTLEKCLACKGLSIITSNAPDIVLAHLKEIREK